MALGEGWEASACGPLAAASPCVVSGLDVQQVANLWCLTSRISLPWAGRQPRRDPWASSYGAAQLPLSTRPGPTRSHGAEALPRFSTGSHPSGPALRAALLLHFQPLRGRGHNCTLMHLLRHFY